MGIPRFLACRKGIITTVFYEDNEGKTEEFGSGITREDAANGLYCCISHGYDESGVTAFKGKFYIDGADPAADIIAADGDVLDGKMVRVQRVTVDGSAFTVKSVKRIYLGSVLHHVEAEVC